MLSSHEPSTKRPRRRVLAKTPGRGRRRHSSTVKGAPARGERRARDGDRRSAAVGGNIRARRGARARARDDARARRCGRRAIDRGATIDRGPARGRRSDAGDAAMRRARRRSRMETIGRITRAMDRAARDAREGRERGGGGARLTIAIRWRRDGGRFGRGTRRDERKGD